MDRYWPERTALFLFGLVVVVLLFLGQGSGTKVGYSDAWMDGFLTIIGHLAIKVLLPIWLLLRLFDGAFFAAKRNRT
jgi:hypothetical protein